jgi:hypothetical protein
MMYTWYLFLPVVRAQARVDVSPMVVSVDSASPNRVRAECSDTIMQLLVEKPSCCTHSVCCNVCTRTITLAVVAAGCGSERSSG